MRGITGAADIEMVLRLQPTEIGSAEFSPSSMFNHFHEPKE
jgi:hypothetical protein